MLSRETATQSFSHICPVCSSVTSDTRYTYRVSEMIFHIYQCQACSFMFMRPLVLELIEDRQMEGMDFAENTFRPLHEALILSREVREIRKLLKVPNPTLLDIGCGTGWTTAYWMRQGFAVTGVEPSVLPQSEMDFQAA